MDNQVKQLYQQIKERKIGFEDAAKQFKLLSVQRRHTTVDLKTVNKNNETIVYPEQRDADGLNKEELRIRLTAALINLASRLLDVPLGEIDSKADFNDYGFDAPLLSEYVKQVKHNYNIELNAGLMQKYPSLDRFAEYLVRHHGIALVKIFAGTSSVYKSNVGTASNTDSAATVQTKSVDTIGVSAPDMENGEFQDKLISYFKKLLSAVLDLPAHRIDADASMEKYGIDSIMVMELTSQLEKTFGSLPKTLFFEYQNIRELTGYFRHAHREKLHELIGFEQNASVTTDKSKHSEFDSQNLKRAVKRRPKRPGRARFGRLSRESGINNYETPLDIAIIGLSGRYPKARNLREFWENLRDGKDCITEIPQARWDHSLYFDEDKNKLGTTYGKWGGFIDGVDEFDPLFFNISPREAEVMDPQERLFMQCVYEVIEDAGYTKDTLCKQGNAGLVNNVGVYVGVMYEEYQLYGAQETILGRPIALSGNPASIANRVSYFCDFHGPSMAIDTMCSSSLTSIHLAGQSLILGDCDVAIAGGVNVSIHPNKYLMLGQGNFISSKGRCESFGEGGDGYVPGEGVGAVLLKPREKAIEDGDHIYGIIKGTAVNHGGKTNGYSVPNPNAQARVIERAFEKAQINPRTVSYLEAHGTGTSLGDPIEISGLNKAFQKYSDDRQFCAIGSAKSNIGHCESAAGIAGLTKVLLQLKYRKLTPSLHSDVLNPNIDFSDSSFVVQQALADWHRPSIVVDGVSREYPRTAGISSFGAGGANAHVVIEEYTPVDVEEIQQNNDGDGQFIIVLSAKDQERLREQVQQLSDVIKAQTVADNVLANMAYTLQVGREAMEERLAMIVTSTNDLDKKLTDYLTGDDSVDDLFRGQVTRNRDTISVFTADEDMKNAIDAWLDKGKYSRLLEMWVRGLIFDWTKLYRGKKPKRISLPTYPFAKERYWVPDTRSLFEGFDTVEHSDNSVSPNRINYGSKKSVDYNVNSNINSRQALSSTIVPDITSEARFMAKHWGLAASESDKTRNGTIAILTTKETSDLATLLEQRLPNSQIMFSDDVASQLQNSEPEWNRYDGFIDLVGCGATTIENLDWIEWIQHLIEHGHRNGLVLLCVTKGLESFDNTAINLTGASRVGLYRMLQSEYRHLHSRHIDADPLANNEITAQQILNEIMIDDGDVEVCYRQGKRHRAYLQELPATNNEGHEPFFPKDHVLWVTGGTRGIGFLCAQHFVTHYGVNRVTLTGREEFPPRNEWETYLAQHSPLAAKIRGIQSLEAQGVKVRVLSLSLTDDNAVRQSLTEIKHTLGPIGGVIHSAGVSDIENPAFIRKNLKGIQRVMDPKVTGLDTMVQCFKDEPLQFFALFSSVSAIIPSLGPGQSDYAMANAYMDYVAEAYHHQFPIVSVQWPSWKESGMGEAKSMAYKQTGLLSHTDKEGLALLDHVLANPAGAVVLPAMVNTGLWKPQQLMQSIIDVNMTDSRLPQVAHLVDLSESSEALVNVTQDWLVSLFSKELRIASSKLDINTPFPDYGVDSILLTQLFGPINQLVTGQLEPTILFEYPTIASLSNWLVSEHASSLSKEFGESSVVAPQIESMEKRPTQSVSAIHQGKAAIQNTPGKGQRTISPKSSDIAVVGLSSRFPGAGDLNAYWQLLSEGRSAIQPVPQHRWKHNGQSYAGLIDSITCFDPDYFMIPNEDARVMDPQALLLLEECLNLWYHAGYTLQEIKGKPIGVYIGARSHHQPDEANLFKARNPIVAVGQNYLAANISQFFDLRGPSLVLDTACSSALVGMNMAIQALHGNEISSALVGGVSVLNNDGAHRIFQQRNILSSEPAFHVFDQRANGIVLGEGVGMVLLKTVDQAIEDGDQIYAVIKALAINNDGRTAGPASPNLVAQKDVMQQALVRSGIRPDAVSYIDVNGSGSEVTDLLELKAIESVYRSNTKNPLGLGAIKPNIGHPLCAEGIASFIKVVLMLNHKQTVPFLSGMQPMTYFDVNSSPFQFSRSNEPWEGSPRLAAINCFADGGTNAHVILEAWEDTETRAGVRKPMPAPTLNRYELRDIETVDLPELKNNLNEVNAAHLVSSVPPSSQNIWKQGLVETTEIQHAYSDT